MTNSELLTDEYLAALMAKEAKKDLKYSGMGFEGSSKYVLASVTNYIKLTPVSRPPANKPKPNTRFLTNIIKDTTSHNQALLAKEAAESRARLQSLATDERRKQKGKGVGGGDIRKRQLGDIAAILGNGGRRAKRPRVEETKAPDEEVSRRRRNTSSDVEEPTPKKRSRTEGHKGRDGEDETDNGPKRSDRDDRGRLVKSAQDESEEDEAEKRSSKSHINHRHRSEDHSREARSRRHSKSVRRPRHETEGDEGRKGVDLDVKRKHRRRDENSEEEDEPRSHRHRRRRHRSRSVSQNRERDRHERKRRHRSRSRSPREHHDKESRHKHKSSHRKRSRSPQEDSHRSRKDSFSSPKKDTNDSSKPDYDSDPLESIIGPAPPPPVRSRGRGTFSQLSGIDSRFSADYDPTADVQLNIDEENDWDQALEALRDRQKWKQQGAARLRAAGFTEEEIGKWEKGGEKREEDVKWAKRGEGREWDRGKVVDEGGAVSIEPKFGRLKDS